ncbi:serpin family protein [Nocardia nova]|uniref:serpin family protein n=1 Tax=Nocardia nova TaxID=37330 RepID=UPI003405AEDE
MQTSLAADVGAANDLTGRWCMAAGSGDFALSGCGVWPLLALLTATAAEPARTELAAAAAVPAARAHALATSLLDRLAAADTLHAALGVWIGNDIDVNPDWLRALPAGSVSALQGGSGLDEWTQRNTGGLIGRFPLDIDESTDLALATAVVARTEWTQPFHTDVLEPMTGPWRGHRGPALARYGRTLGDAVLLDADPPVTRVTVRGTGDLDVHLLLGPDSCSPATVLAAGLHALDGSVGTRPVSADSAGVRVRDVVAIGDSLRIELPPFDIHHAHDLLREPDLFGLRAAATPVGHPFPGLSATPVFVSGAAQHVRARFTAEGFHAAAVTAVGLSATGSPPAPTPGIEIAVTFDRPFGFLAVHRPTGLVIVAGWVATPPTW